MHHTYSLGIVGGIAVLAMGCGGDRWCGVGGFARDCDDGGNAGGWGQAASGGRLDPAVGGSAGDGSDHTGWNCRPTGIIVEPSARYAKVWTGSDILIYGQGQGWKYSPSTDRLASIRTEGAPVFEIVPEPRAAWANERMVVVGWAADSPHLTGGIYDPQTDSWSTLAPNSLFDPMVTVLAAGSKVMVLTEAGQSGGLLDPVANTWEGLAADAAPYTVLYEPSTNAVWAGTSVILWDGLGMHGTVHGGIYHPSSNSWSTISSQNAVSGHYSPAAAWADGRMLVWGGYDGQRGPVYPGYLNSGAVYDLAMDTWTSTTVESAPSGRSTHLAISDGHRVFVFGGMNLSGCETTGAVYDTRLDAWDPMLPDGAPCLQNGTPHFNSALAFWRAPQLFVLDSPSELCTYTHPRSR